MRRLEIKHLTEYRFPNAVTLLPHRLMLRPRVGYDVRIESSKLDISPNPRIKWHRDVFDNSVAVVSFRGVTERLTVRSEIMIQHYEMEPLDFIVEDYAVHYPFAYHEEERVDLAPFQQSVYPDQWSTLRAWIKSWDLLGSKMETYVLLDRLNRFIAKEFKYIVREEPGVQSPEQTLAKRSGSCRDYATLFIETCRFLGLASRFVSGYSYVPELGAGGAATHAWAEVYLPGPGWKGFDPTAGELTGNRHIPVAVARHPETVPPVAGSFLGPEGLTPTLRVEVQVTAL